MEFIEPIVVSAEYQEIARKLLASGSLPLLASGSLPKGLYDTHLYGMGVDALKRYSYREIQEIIDELSGILAGEIAPKSLILEDRSESELRGFLVEALRLRENHIKDIIKDQII